MTPTQEVEAQGGSNPGNEGDRLLRLREDRELKRVFTADQSIEGMTYSSDIRGDTMNPEEILIDHCYRTKAGTLCRVNAFTDNDVVFIPYKNEAPGEPQQMALELFAANIDEEVPLPRTD